ncbi:MAG: His/Gly/Thr/Pro-type tRNA ligase C-terminal domain-containing protein [Candidatus Gracilibacteria bacterium]|nr:His/Gly/Thr/Pro-type tRNA ligase C-terminal domain-containing protein [Candidatus Gracilibacteria bacterium]
MLQLSKFPVKTLKSSPKVSDNKSTSFLLQAGFIRQEMAGVYNYLPFGLKVLRKIENIVREEMNATGAQEILMPALGSKDHWEQTGRWNSIDVLFHLPASDNKEYALNPTHEDLVTPLMSEFVQSYKDLEFGVYQIQNKFRNEKRAKSGLLRGREFLMKDLYSFHKSEETLLAYYNEMKKAYKKVFDRLGLGADTYETLASGGDFTTLNSHEYQTVLGIGEDEIYICDECKTSHNKEVVDLVNGFSCSKCNSKNHKIEKACEVGNIFPLMTKFTDAFDMKYTDSDGKVKEVYMGCYGIGISRLMGVIAEYFMDSKGLIWPENIAPVTHYMVVMGDNLEKAKELAKKLESEGKEVIIDDREKVGFGQKASDADLLGIPYRVVVSDKTLEAGGYELKSRISDETQIISI